MLDDLGYLWVFWEWYTHQCRLVMGVKTRILLIDFGGFFYFESFIVNSEHLAF